MKLLLLYLAGSSAAIAIMVGICVILFGKAASRLDPKLAVARLKEEIVGFRPGAMICSTGGDAALVENAATGAIHLVAARGGGIVTRRLSRGFVQEALCEGGRLDLRLADFTFPRAAIAFESESAALDWRRRLPLAEAA